MKPYSSDNSIECVKITQPGNEDTYRGDHIRDARINSGNINGTRVNKSTGMSNTYRKQELNQYAENRFTNMDSRNVGPNMGLK